MKNKMKIILVAGARPNFMKVAPIYFELKKDKQFEPIIVHTGQHYDKEMSDFFFRDLGLPKPHIYLGVGSASHAIQTAKIMEAFEPICLKHRPNLVMVVGDVNSTIACALTAVKLGIKVAHVEAGLRSFDRTMPEEINRLLTDQISDMLFTTCKDANDNLIKEGIDKKKIFFVGNVMIDSLRNSMQRMKEAPIQRIKRIRMHYNMDYPVKPGNDREAPGNDREALGNDREALGNDREAPGNDREALGNDRRGAYALVTLHRPSNVDDKFIFKNIMWALNQIAKRIPVIFPVHPRTAKKLTPTLTLPLRGGGKRRGGTNGGLILTPPLGYLEFLNLMANAALVLTDSGGIQEETTILGVPCLTIRENTERPITITQGTNKLVGTDPKRIVKEAFKIIANCGFRNADLKDTKLKQKQQEKQKRQKKLKRPALWDGKAAERIVARIAKFVARRKGQ